MKLKYMIVKISILCILRPDFAIPLVSITSPETFKKGDC